MAKSLYRILLLLSWTAIHLVACGQSTTSKASLTTITNKDKKMEIATFGAGCFWCVEAVFQRLEGVEKVVSGYTGGTTQNPTYKEICTGTTGHAEVCQITYDPT
ncbi:MAG: peptide-methionine (S)-S-oxide reductase, partial [Candidatus Fonsibacter sp.]